MGDFSGVAAKKKKFEHFFAVFCFFKFSFGVHPANVQFAEKNKLIISIFDSQIIQI
jgi:hypothetical protein